MPMNLRATATVGQQGQVLTTNPIATYGVDWEAGGVSRTLTPSGDTTGATDYVTLQTAMNNAVANGGSTILFNPGVYYVNQPLVLAPASTSTVPVAGPSLVAFNAQGHIGDNVFPTEVSTVTIVVAPGFPLGKYILDFQQSGAPNHVGFSGMWIKGISFVCRTGGVNTAAGIRLMGTRQCHVEDVTVTQAAAKNGAFYPGEAFSSGGAFTCNGDAGFVTAAAYNLFERITVSNSDQDGIQHNTPGQDTFVGCHIVSCGRYGISTLLGNSQATFVNCDVFVAPSAANTSCAYNVGSLRNVFVGCTQASNSCPFNCVVIGNDNGGGNPAFEQARFYGMHFENNPAAAPGEQLGAVIAVTGNHPSASFIGCDIIAHTNTSDFVYVSNAVQGFAPVTFEDCYFGGTVTTNKFNDNSGFNVLRFKNNQGLNPIGQVTVAVPGSGVVLAAAAYDRTFYAVAGVGGLTFSIQGGPAPNVPAGQFCSIHLPAGLTMTLTYTNAPSWGVEGE